MNPIILNKVSIADIPHIQTMANQIWQSYYPSIIGQQQVDYMLGEMYSNAALLKQMEDGQKFFFIQTESTVAGFIAVSEKEKGEFFLHKFYINTHEHGKGIGSNAFQALVQMFPTMHTLRLQVNRFNIKPINFYFKMGFIIEKADDFDIGNGYFMNDYVMLWRKNW